MKRKPVFKLNSDEQNLEAEIERGEWTSLPKAKADKLRDKFVASAERQNKEARVNLRLNPDDIARIRQKAEREGIPYQTLIASVLHKFATDQFLDEVTVRTVARKISGK